MNSVHFIMEGTVNLYSETSVLFMQILPGNVLGDYQSLFDLKTNFSAVANLLILDKQEEQGCKMMEVRASFLKNLAELYPKTHVRL